MEFLLAIGALLLIALAFSLAPLFSRPKKQWPDNDTIDRQGFANTVRNLTVNQVTSDGGIADMSWQKAVLPADPSPPSGGYQGLEGFLSSAPATLFVDTPPETGADENTALMNDILARLGLDYRAVDVTRDPEFFATLPATPCLFLWGEYFTDAKGLLDRIHDGNLSEALDKARLSYDKKVLDTLQTASQNA